MFQVTEERGFLPIFDPPENLPEKFKPLEDLLTEMPITKKNGQKGLLSSGELAKKAESLPMYGCF